MTTLLTLSCKVTSLLALSTLLRVSEIAGIDKKSIIFSEEAVEFSLSRPRKWQRSGTLATFKLNKLKEENVCPVECLGHYIGRTERLRGQDNQDVLFISTTPPHHPTDGQTVARWIKKLMFEAGIDTGFSAHSTRSAASSKDGHQEQLWILF